jgi:hypothetical protein
MPYRFSQGEWGIGSIPWIYRWGNPPKAAWC